MINYNLENGWAIAENVRSIENTIRATPTVITNVGFPIRRGTTPPPPRRRVVSAGLTKKIYETIHMLVHLRTLDNLTEDDRIDVEKLLDNMQWLSTQNRYVSQTVIDFTMNSGRVRYGIFPEIPVNPVPPVPPQNFDVNAEMNTIFTLVEGVYDDLAIRRVDINQLSSFIRLIKTTTEADLVKNRMSINISNSTRTIKNSIVRKMARIERFYNLMRNRNADYNDLLKEQYYLLNLTNAILDAHDLNVAYRGIIEREQQEAFEREDQEEAAREQQEAVVFQQQEEVVREQQRAVAAEGMPRRIGPIPVAPAFMSACVTVVSVMLFRKFIR